MPPLRIFCSFLLFTFTLVFLSRGDDVQVIRSGKSVLSIYSYGEGARTRFAPELPDRSTDHRPKASLTDVVASPPLSFSVRMRETGINSGKAQPFAITPSNATTASNSTTANKMARTNTVVRTASMSAESAPPSPTITVSWQSSPESDVAGYNVYIGNARHEYALYQTLGNQTSASIGVSDGAIFLAITAYTADGLESPLSEELMISAISQGGAPSPVGFGASNH